MPTKNRGILLTLLCAILGVLVLVGMQSCKEQMRTRALFCWNSPTGENAEALLKIANEYSIGELYLNCAGADAQSINAFLQAAKDVGLDVFWLAGDPTWATDADGTEMIRQVESAAALRQSAGSVMRGIVLDVEPYLLEDWDENSDAWMRSFVQAARCAYQEAHRQGLEMILCVPYYYDQTGYAEHLEELIAHACDRVAVMNYYRKDEIEHIATEAAYAQAYDKGLINIYELQPPGEHGLQEINTYYNLGMEAVEQSFGDLQRAYPELDLYMALHDAKAIEEGFGVE